MFLCQKLKLLTSDCVSYAIEILLCSSSFRWNHVFRGLLCFSQTDNYFYSCNVKKMLYFKIQWAPSKLFRRDVELRSVHKKNPQVSWSSFQLQHRDVVGQGGAKQGSGDKHSLLRPSGWPVSSQVHTINPNLTLMREKQSSRRIQLFYSLLETWGK